MVVYRFRPKLLPTLATLALLPLLVQLGLWQWHKAQAKEELQQRIDALATVPPLWIGPQTPMDLARQRRVTVRGHYETAHQILLDNQIHGEQAGYHVLTTLRIEGGETRVLVNRGWVAVGRSRAVLPDIAPPRGVVTLSGTVWQAATPQLALAAPTPSGPVWPVFDAARYRAQVPFAMQPFAIRLDPGAPGCYVCEWPRVDEKIGMHRGYAAQWFGMALVLVVFYVHASVTRERSEG